MLSFYNKYKGDVYSQNGEDGIVEEILRRISSLGFIGHVVEFGAHNGIFCSNSRLLITNGWSALLIEGSSELYAQCSWLYIENENHIQCLLEMVTPANVNELLPAYCTVLSIDVDGIDYLIWEAYKGHADIVIIEINSSIHPAHAPVIGDPVRGTSFTPMIQLGLDKGYFPICHCGNIIFVHQKHRKHFPEIPDPGKWKTEEFFNDGWLK